MSHPLRPELPPLPERMRRLPIDARGYPVPFFVAVVNGVPDHRVADGAKLAQVVQHRLCWLCGQRLGTYLAFTIGPMCAVNRTAADPPAHKECAQFAVRACPFLSRPHAKRREAGLPDAAVPAAGLPILRNPGVSLIWMTKEMRVDRVGDGILFRFGLPTALFAYAEGRPATTEELEESIRTGLPVLWEVAKHEGALTELLANVRTARRLLGLPAEAPAVAETATP